MSEQKTEQTSPRRKWINNLMLVVLMVVLPVISYMYLKNGFEWRKQAQSELGDYGKIRGAYVIYADGTKENQLKGRVCVLHMFGANPDLTPGNKNIIDVSEKLYDQFGFKTGDTRDDFRLVMISEGGTSEFRSYYQKLPSIDMVTWVWTGGLGSWTTILQNGFDYYCQSNKVSSYPNYFAVSDTSGTIRRFYNADDPAEVGRMVEHVAILLPK